MTGNWVSVRTLCFVLSICIAARSHASATDLEASFRCRGCVTEGPRRNAVAFRVHLRASPKLLAGINQHLEAIEELLKIEANRSAGPSPDDQHLSLTLALLPLKGRRKEKTEEED